MKVVTAQTKKALNDAIFMAEQDKSNLTEFERDLYGNSGRKVRHAINNVCNIKENSVYLELGIYRGSTLVSALYDSKVSTAYAVDDFTIDQKEAHPYRETGWNNVRNAFSELTTTHRLSKLLKPTIIESTADKVDVKKIVKKLDIIHYDLDEHHTNLESTIRHYIPILDKFTILLVSNWNSKGVRDAWKRLGQTPGLDIELIVEKQSSNTGDTANWYNGFSISVMELKATAKAETDD